MGGQVRQGEAPPQPATADANSTTAIAKRARTSEGTVTPWWYNGPLNDGQRAAR